MDKWNRAVDPSTDLPKAFGFCTYRTAQAAAVCVQVRERELEMFCRGSARVGWGNPGVSLVEGQGSCGFWPPCESRARRLHGHVVVS